MDDTMAQWLEWVGVGNSNLERSASLTNLTGPCREVEIAVLPKASKGVIRQPSRFSYNPCGEVEIAVHVLLQLGPQQPRILPKEETYEND